MLVTLPARGGLTCIFEALCAYSKIRPLPSLAAEKWGGGGLFSDGYSTSSVAHAQLHYEYVDNVSLHTSSHQGLIHS